MFELPAVFHQMVNNAQVAADVNFLIVRTLRFDDVISLWLMTECAFQFGILTVVQCDYCVAVFHIPIVWIADRCAVACNTVNVSAVKLEYQLIFIHGRGNDPY